MEITKEQIEKIVRSRMPFGIKSKRGKMLFPFKTIEMFEKTIDCLSNGIYEDLSKLHLDAVSICACGSDNYYAEVHKDVTEYYCAICHEKISKH